MNSSEVHDMASADRPAPRGSGVSFIGGFVARAQLAELLYRGLLRKVSQGVVVAGRQQFELHQAVRVLAAVDVAPGGADPNELIGFVERVERLGERGITMTTDAILVGDHSYAIERGVIAETVRESAA